MNCFSHPSLRHRNEYLNGIHPKTGLLLLSSNSRDDKFCADERLKSHRKIIGTKLVWSFVFFLTSELLKVFNESNDSLTKQAKLFKK